MEFIMRIFGKQQKSSTLVKNVVSKMDIYQFSLDDPDNYDDFDPVTNFCVIFPFGDKLLLVEVSAVDRTLKIHLKLRGVVENDLDISFKNGIIPNYISVGELTLHEKIIVNYDALLTMEIQNSNGNKITVNADLFTIRELEIICSQALELLLCDRIFVVNKNFYLDGGFGLIPKFSLI
ncbi:MAG TPA: hypothetical protein DEG92_07115 [Rikenellaceae bacterium]|nr:hypothetical protein [Rikenellaceae bacterium]